MTAKIRGDSKTSLILALSPVPSRSTDAPLYTGHCKLKTSVYYFTFTIITLPLTLLPGLSGHSPLPSPAYFARLQLKQFIYLQFFLPSGKLNLVAFVP